MTLSELQILLTNQNGVLSEQNVHDFSQSYFNVDITQAWVEDFIDLDDEIDWVLSHSFIYYVTSKIVVDLCFNDNDDSETSGIYDHISNSLGNTIERKINRSSLPQDLKDKIFFDIGVRLLPENGGTNDSSKLQTAINNVP